MDKYEYKVRAEEIKALIAEGEFAEAVKIADTIDWRRVKSVMMLCTISDLYKINRRFQESKDILLMAYERHPGGRLIVYSLCELSIKMGEVVQGIEYYKEFVQIAPKDTGRYILQYKLYEAQDVSLEERIAVLEEFKKRDYREKWAYELAYLYHRVGLETKCVEECDEMFVWFSDGRYVMKALELKMLHQPLSAQQQEKYEWMKRERERQIAGLEEEGIEEEILPAEGEELPEEALPEMEQEQEEESLGENMADFPEYAGQETEEEFKVVPKVPYKFSYTFEDTSGKQSTLMIEDWEIGMLYFNCLKKHHNESIAVSKVKEKYFDEFSKRDLYFFMGTTKKFHNVAPNPFIIIGVFYPPFKLPYEQMTLFAS